MTQNEFGILSKTRIFLLNGSVKKIDMKRILFVLLISIKIASILCDNVNNGNTEDKSRSKRQILGVPLVFAGTFKYLVGFACPVHAENYVKLLFVLNYQYQYVEAQNSSEISQYFGVQTVSREQREAEWAGRRNERLTFYRSVEELMTSKGFNGPACLRRAICEAAQYPVQDEALVGEILHILLTPNYGRNNLEEDVNWNEEMEPYLSAYTAGEQMFQCVSIYNECPEGQGVLELISELQDD